MKQRNLGILRFLLMIGMFCLMTSCGTKEGTGQESTNMGAVPSAKKEDAPLYDRTTTQYQLAEDANPYMMEFGPEGFFYFVMGASEDGEIIQDDEEGLTSKAVTGGNAKNSRNNPEGIDDDETELALAYQFYYQGYDGKEAIPFCTVQDGYVRDFSCLTREGEMVLSVLVAGDTACIMEFDKNGKPCGEISLDDRFQQLEAQEQLLALPEGYVIAVGDQVSFLDMSGRVTAEAKLEGQVQELYASSQGMFATVYRNPNAGGGSLLVKLDDKKAKAEALRELPQDVMKVFAIEEGFAAVYHDRITLFQAGKEPEEAIVDLDRQELMASQIQYFQSENGEIDLISMDPYDQEHKVYRYHLKVHEETDDSQANASDKNALTAKEREKFAADGRRIVYVAIPKNCAYSVEFHAKKYNQTSDQVMIRVERISESLEDYLGKGNRPDIVMFQDQTDLPNFVQKNLLADLLQLCEQQDAYSLDDVIPKAKECLGISGDEGMYAMAGRFRLLLYPSDGTEVSADGRCDAVQYLKWYDNYLTEQEMEGIGQIENLLYDAVLSFYDEETARADFTSEAFEELLKTYLEVRSHHKGEWKNGYTSDEMARGPFWYASYRSTAMAKTGARLQGLPDPYGERRVVIRFYYPMSILATSDCQAESFDFLMYYNSLGELLQVGWPESDYGKSSSTEAIFSVYQHLLDEYIFDWDDAFMTFGTLDENGMPTDVKLYYLPEEQKDQLRFLIDSAIPETKTQRVIYEMLMEEAEGYFSDDKDLKSVCKILQNRAELYLKEQR